MSKVDVLNKPFQPPVAAPVATPEANLSPQSTSSSWHSLNTSTSGLTHERSPDVETILRLSLLQYLTTLLPAPAPGLFPIPSSTFYERHILPFRPSWAPTQAAVIQKTSYKKVGKWLKAVSLLLSLSFYTLLVPSDADCDLSWVRCFQMEKEGLVKLKSSKDQDSVVSVDLKHAAVQGHKAHVTVSEQQSKDKRRAAREAASGGGASAEPSAVGDGAGPSVVKKAKVQAIREVFKPSGQTLPFWTAINISPDSLLTAQEVRSHLQAYITANTAVPRDQSVVYLDDVLKRALLKKTEDGLVRLKKVQVEERMRKAMTQFFAVDRLGEEGVLRFVQPFFLQ